MNMRAAARVTALLGPTNTGKTHLAIDRMLGHSSGMIGFPLRLLARENYERVVRLKGARQVALVTGEEKILPPTARYFLCTVESMPLDRQVEFLAIDEVQLCADAERGHVFTDRLLHARGISETMFLGSDTIRPLLRSLVPEAEFTARPRFSTLAYAGPQKLTRLPPRSAVVAFSAAEVYAMAEVMRRQRGGTAVVLGALSPRTRNAQVEMFEAGEVDYLVATDAIGMGLNLNLDHVAFARLGKFDGRQSRRLAAPEIAQIAGRAGRHMSDGTFGTTAEVGPIEPEIVEAVENHEFEALRALYWRSRSLDFASPRALLKSLEKPPAVPQLVRAPEAEDHQALAYLAKDAEIAAMATTPGAVRLLWDVCQVPDFRKILSDHHARLLGQVYRHLMGAAGRLPDDWIADNLKRIDRVDGDIDSLVQRIAHVRTWNYITHRGDWVADPRGWQEQARAVEDRLSDALHERLTQRFVDRRTAALVRRLADGSDLIGAVRRDGEVLVEGEHVGWLSGFRFQPDAVTGAEDQRPLLAAARRALAGEIPARVRQLENDDDGSFLLEDGGRLSWRGHPVARLVPGSEPLKPEVRALDSDLLDGSQRQRIAERVSRWLERYLANRLSALYRLRDPALAGTARGIAFRVVEALGCLPREAVAADVANLGKAERKALAEHGLKIGRESLWVPALAKPATRALRARLLAIHRGEPPLATDGLAPVMPAERDWDEAALLAVGYRLVERRRRRGPPRRLAVEAGRLERIVHQAFQASRAAKGRFRPAEKLVGEAGDAESLTLILAACGFHIETDENGVTAVPRRNRPRKAAGAEKRGKKGHGEGHAKPGKKSGANRTKAGGEKAGGAKREKPEVDADSPFAVLAAWRAAE